MLSISSTFKNMVLLSVTNNKYFLHFVPFDQDREDYFYKKCEVAISSEPKQILWCGNKLVVQLNK